MERVRAHGGALAVAFLLTSCSSRAPGPRIEPALARLTPSDTQLAAGLRLDVMRDAPAYRVLESAAPKGWVEEFGKRSGLDLRRDVTEVLVASNGRDAVVLARGRFDVPRLESLMAESGAKRLPHGSRTLFGREDAAAVFFDGGTVAVGPAKTLRSIIDQPGGIPAPILAALATLPPQSQAWLAATGVSQWFRLPGFNGEGALNAENFNRVLGSLQTVTGAAELGASIDVRLTGDCATPDAARTLHDALRGFLGMGRLATSADKADLLRLFDAVAITKQDRTVRVSALIPADLVEKLPAIARGR